MNRIISAFALLAAAAALPACSTAPAEEPPLADARIGGPFELTGTDGQTVRDSDFAGKYRLLYFGYTFCPDVCPTDVAKIGRGLKLFEEQDPERAAKVVPIFVSVDPGRDTPDKIAAFVGAMHPRMVGLTGTKEQIDSITRAYGAYYQILEPNAEGGYLVNHPSWAYLMGPDGEPIDFVNHDHSAEQLAEKLDRWVK